MKILQIVLMAAVGTVHTLLTTEQHQLVLCALTVFNRHFRPGGPLLLSLPRIPHNVTQTRSLALKWNLTYDVHLVDSMLKEMHETSLWQLRVSVANKTKTVNGEGGKIHYYVVITWPERTDDEIFENALEQFHSFNETNSWNPRALFFLIVTGTTQAPQRLAFRLFDELWRTENILNIVLLVPTHFESPVHDDVARIVFDLYTWFPYRSGHCANVTEVTVVDRWILTKQGDFSNHVPLFPHKIPANLQACPLTVSAEEIEPYVFLTDTKYDTQKYRGLDIQFLLIISQVMNTTLVYLPQPTSDVGDVIDNLLHKRTDVAVGGFFLHRLFIEYSDATTPYFQSSMQWLVPCPTPVHKVERVLGIFTLTVWFTFIMFLFLTAVTVWCVASSHFTLPEQESPMYRTLSGSLYNLWAVVLCVSVAEQPRTSRLRVLFLLFVCYTFGFNVVFQAFFMTFLVEPGFRKPIATMDELIHSGILYGYDNDTEIFLTATNYSEHLKLESSRVQCPDYDKYLERLIIERDIIIVYSTFEADYTVLKLFPIYEQRKYVCSLDQDIYKTINVMCLQLGSPLLDRFNTIIRRTIEAGLVDFYWSMLKWETRIKTIAKSVNDGSPADSDQYFPLALSHLKVAFYILILGYILSSVTFIGELLYAQISTHRK